MATLRIADIRPLYAFVDPHGGQAGATSARLKRVASSAAICVGGLDSLGRYFIVDAWSDRVSTDDLIERMYAVCSRWSVKSFGGESNGLAGLWLDALARDARRANRHLPIVKVPQPSNIEKDYRIRTILQPLVGNGRLFIARHLTPLVDQICAFPMSMQKDLIDSCASLCRFIPPRPRAHTESAEREHLARYLRDRGVDPDIIRREVYGEEESPRPWTSFTTSLSR